MAATMILIPWHIAPHMGSSMLTLSCSCTSTLQLLHAQMVHVGKRYDLVRAHRPDKHQADDDDNYIDDSKCLASQKKKKKKKKKKTLRSVS
eukprot:NODE_13446_length_1165_cov_6.693642.p6 GENE.NODE_13446_length_1165_cov_6.693642~~NODE_13446_length_1165_cov_6.693642.p6  ORF type:complete len:91 (+),score=28.64 NODE_13446_length_1165_cov_6.693642:801-1073(+)